MQQLLINYHRFLLLLQLKIINYLIMKQQTSNQMFFLLTWLNLLSFFLNNKTIWKLNYDNNKKQYF